MHECVLSRFSHVRLFATLWTLALFSPRDSPGKNTGVDCQALLQEIFPTRDQTRISCLLHWQVGSLLLGPLEKTMHIYIYIYIYIYLITSEIFKQFTATLMMEGRNTGSLSTASQFTFLLGTQQDVGNRSASPPAQSVFFWRLEDRVCLRQASQSPSPTSHTASCPPPESKSLPRFLESVS